MEQGFSAIDYIVFILYAVLKSVAWTDFIQVAFLIAGGLITAYVALDAVAGQYGVDGPMAGSPSWLFCISFYGKRRLLRFAEPPHDAFGVLFLIFPKKCLIYIERLEGVQEIYD